MTIGYPPPLIFQPSFRLRNWKSGQSMLGPKWHGAASSATKKILRVLPGDHQLTTRSQHPPRSNPFKSARCTRWPSKSPISLNLPRLITYHGAVICPMVTGLMLRLYCIGYWYESPYHLFMGHLNIGANADALKILRQMSTEKIWKNHQHEDGPSTQWDYHLSTSKCRSKTLTTEGPLEYLHRKLLAGAESSAHIDLQTIDKPCDFTKWSIKNTPVHPYRNTSLVMSLLSMII